MFITPEQANKRLTSANNLALNIKNNIKKRDYHDDPIQHRRMGGGRQEGDNNVPQPIREIIAITAHDGRRKEVADAFGVTPNTVTEYKNGHISKDKEDPALMDIKKNNLEKAQDLAAEKLLRSLELLDFDNERLMDKMNIRDLSNIATNISRVVEKTNPNKDKENTKLILYAPLVNQETHYNTIEITSEP